MHTYTQEELDRLITLSKTIIEPPRKQWAEAQGHLKNGMKLQSIEGNYFFSVYMRMNASFQENYSIGLDYLSKEDGRIHLLRCNGPHGSFGLSFQEHHPFPHIHKINAEIVNENGHPLLWAEQTETYTVYEQALIFFCRYTNIIEFEKYFPEFPLFDSLKENEK